ncbi:MAG TPA: arsenic resistance N-acetyltransferase ArsN2 [Patescibacteria group bacterium]|nr:arsenic resistance N-acetyltransferase ArsN2 [Patescibacteria group bacterium]
MRPVRAEADDWPAIRDLLTASGLPLDGAREAFDTGVVIRESDRIVGCAAVEPYRPAAILRSVAVAPDRRGSGNGRRLVSAAEAVARDNGSTDLILLTETAERWFSRLGFVLIDRTAVPAEVAASVEFQTACSTSAVAMRRPLA